MTPSCSTQQPYHIESIASHPPHMSLAYPFHNFFCFPKAVSILYPIGQHVYRKFTEHFIPEWMNPHARKIHDHAAVVKFSRLWREQKYVEKKRARKWVMHRPTSSTLSWFSFLKHFYEVNSLKHCEGEEKPCKVDVCLHSKGGITCRTLNMYRNHTQEY